MTVVSMDLKDRYSTSKTMYCIRDVMPDVPDKKCALLATCKNKLLNTCERPQCRPTEKIMRTIMVSLEEQ